MRTGSEQPKKREKNQNTSDDVQNTCRIEAVADCSLDRDISRFFGHDLNILIPLDRRIRRPLPRQIAININLRIGLVCSNRNQLG